MKKWLGALLATALIGTAGAISFGQAQPAYAVTSLTIDDTLLGKLGTMLEGEKTRIILTYSHQPTQGELLALKALGITGGLVLNKLPMVILDVNKTQLNTLLHTSLAGLLSIYADKELTYFLDQSVKKIGADKVHNEPGFGFTGRDIGVAVVDSGIDATHPDLKLGTRVAQNVKVAGHDILNGFLPPLYVENVPDSDNAGGHGTHVAGTIAGDGTASGGKYAGVAPGAHLVGVSAGATLFITSALQGLDYVLTHREQYNIQAVNNSWGTTGEFDPNDPINIASKALHDAGVTVLFAAGNEGPDTNTQNPYSVAPWVIAVAAGTKDTGRLADFSSRGIPGDALYHPTLTAPGVDIIAAKAKQSVLAPLSLQKDLQMIPLPYQPYYTTMSGTSMATPHVAGVVALLEQANPSLTPDQVKQLLIDTVDPMTGYQEFEVGQGYVNAYRAVLQSLK
jgi:serine protease AprX